MQHYRTEDELMQCDDCIINTNGQFSYFRTLLSLSFIRIFLNALNKHSVSASLKTNATNRKLNFMQMQTIPIHRFFLFKHYLTTSLSFSFCVINLVKGSKADIRRTYFFALGFVHVICFVTIVICFLN